jgi:hypothetical protein
LRTYEPYPEKSCIKRFGDAFLWMECLRNLHNKIEEAIGEKYK